MLWNDAISGTTAGILAIAQGMAYAMIAGLPPVFGLYAALTPQIVYAFMGTSRQLSIGPVAMDSLIVAAGIGTLHVVGIDQRIRIEDKGVLVGIPEPPFNTIIIKMRSCTRKEYQQLHKN